MSGNAANVTMLSVTLDARTAMKRIQKRLFPNVSYPTYSDTIYEIERRLNELEASEHRVDAS